MPRAFSEHMDVNKDKSKFGMGTSAGISAHERIKTILLVDDAVATRLMTKWFLSYVGYVVQAFSSAEEALAQFDPKLHDLVVTDNSMPQMTGLEMAHIIKLRSPATPVVMYTESLPKDRSCLDALLQRSTPLPALKDAVAKLLATQP
jgi:CheY-like chemotaxis protein